MPDPTHRAESVAPCCQRLMESRIVCTVPLHQECPKCERRWLWDQGTWTALTDGTACAGDVDPWVQDELDRMD
jgi:hypothetical protein